MLEKVYIVPSAPLLDPYRSRNNTICGYVNRKNNIKDFQRSEVTFAIGIPAHLNELQEGDRIIQNLKKRKAKWHKNCALELSTSK